MKIITKMIKKVMKKKIYIVFKTKLLLNVKNNENEKNKIYSSIYKVIKFFCSQIYENIK